MIELDRLHSELAGMNLIEASAGTGKTYAIACLYLRLLIERNLTPEQILVVTYTEAATKELHGRIRSRIREALDVFEGAATTDDFLAGLVANIDERGGESCEKLRGALNAFDTASIFTIHGFCLRALKENAFESGSLYDTELVTDQTELLQEIIDDFWRMHFFTGTSPLLITAIRHGYSPLAFKKFLEGMLSNPLVEIIPNYSGAEIAALEERCQAVYERVRREWREHGEEIREIIGTDKGLSRALTAYKEELLPDLFGGMDCFLDAGCVFELFQDFGKFTASGIRKGTKGKGTSPVHSFFDRCEELQEAVKERLVALKSELVQYCREQLPLRKHKSNCRFFDDLLNDLWQSLQGQGGEALSANLRNAYRAALIDEFQDTDPVQYDIFRMVYQDSGYPVFLIGDPKQAIYSFRGADIFAYMKAAEDIDRGKRFTLTGNWRSSPSLLAALNRVFTNTAKPFLYDRIAYHPVTPGGEGNDNELFLAGFDPAPLQVWQILPPEAAATITVEKANNDVALAVAAEISRLLRAGREGRALIKNRPLHPEDLAVIVRSHRQAGYVQKALSSLGVPNVVQSDKSIFATPEAREVCTLLRALANPGNEAAVRAALVTEILGKSGDDIARLIDAEEEWENCLVKFGAYHQTWQERGFMVMIQSLLDQEGIRGRLLYHREGERKLTNLLHCFELLHSRAEEWRLGMAGLVTWFNESVSVGEKNEENQLRLETDEEAVRIVTVHISKGLEYPIVFCPYFWRGIREVNAAVTFHDDYRMVKDFGSPAYGKNRLLAQKEALAENLRLLYVALTRAQYRCYLCTGKIGRDTMSGFATSPLAYLFHSSRETAATDDPVGTLLEEIARLGPAEMEAQLGGLENRGEGAIALVSLPEPVPDTFSPPIPEQEDTLSVRKFGGIIDNAWRVASFTFFTSHERGALELPDRDEISAEIESGERAGGGTSEDHGIFAFPRGAQAGIFFHEIFESLDFRSSSPEYLRTLVERGLEKYGFESEWLSGVAAMVNRVITAPLSTPAGYFTLSDLRPGSWITELEFYFPLRFIKSGELQGALKKWGGTAAAANLEKVFASLRFQPVGGMVRGFMDMVFEHEGRYYLVDWKSNHLGDGIEDYGQKALKEVMEKNLYPFQYLLYTVALNKYLALRVWDYDYSTHFGGVLYVFIRGISPEGGERFGIYRDIPPPELIGILTRTLIEEEG